MDCALQGLGWFSMHTLSGIGRVWAKKIKCGVQSMDVCAVSATAGSQGGGDEGKMRRGQRQRRVAGLILCILIDIAGKSAAVGLVCC